MNNNVLLIDFGDTGNESEAIRQCLESLGYNVFKRNIGRPGDFIKILSGNYFAEYKYLIISCHGKGGKVVMPELHESVYLENEPRGDFGAEEIARYIKIENKVIISTGCGTGKPEEMRKAFMNDINIYIAPDDYPGGDSALYFVLSLFYFLKNNDLPDSFSLAKNIDKETAFFNMSKP